MQASTQVGILFDGLFCLVPIGFFAYGVTRYNLFDIDLKVKWTIKQSTLAAAFVGVFFAGSLGPVMGLGKAGLLVFAIAPLQRVAERVADAALPGVRGSPEYDTFRKLEIDRAALESAAEDGETTPKERAVLATLRKQLSVGAEDASTLEADVLRREGSPADLARVLAMPRAPQQAS